VLPACGVRKTDCSVSEFHLWGVVRVTSRGFVIPNGPKTGVLPIRGQFLWVVSRTTAHVHGANPLIEEVAPNLREIPRGIAPSLTGDANNWMVQVAITGKPEGKWTLLRMSKDSSGDRFCRCRDCYSAGGCSVRRPSVVKRIAAGRWEVARIIQQSDP
jgi:hypothetical protein